MKKKQKVEDDLERFHLLCESFVVCCDLMRFQNTSPSSSEDIVQRGCHFYTNRSQSLSVQIVGHLSSMNSKLPSEDATAGASSAAAPTMSSPFDGLNISKIMSSTGPVVKCVLLRAAAAATADDADEVKPKADDEKEENDTSSLLQHQHLIDEIEVDTTPRKSQVNTILGGPFTFLGQYEDEGIVIMIRRPTIDDDDGNDEDEKEEDDDDKKHGPINPHRLQPPFHNVMVRGDILLMKVAPATDDDEADATLNEDGDVATKTAVMMTAPSSTTTTNDNDEFFLDYTKEEYLIFASRTDIIATAEDEEEENEDDEESVSSNGNDENDEEAVEFRGEGDDDDSDNEEDFDPNDESDDDDDDDDDEESQVAMMNMVLNMMIKQFREKNDGRGPDSAELLAMRKALADRMGIENVTGPDDVTPSKTGSNNHEERRSAKKVVVAEEMNETTPIPRRRSRSSSSNEEDEDIEEVYDEDAGELKRPAPQDDVDDDEQEQGSCKKKAKTT